jgi:predicted CXXCH cytochrome family protein
VFGACVALAVLGSALTRQATANLAAPRSLATTEYVGSNACRNCHPRHYESFARTYHRTMTQEASTTSVLGNFDGTSLDYLGVRARMQRGTRGEFLMSFSAAGGSERWLAQVERSVGSHHYQQYLARVDDVYFRLPIAWDVAENRFIHMNGAFLTADPDLAANGGRVARVDYNRHVTRWNDNCVFCHNVHPNPGLDPATGRFDTQVAELGVACEACHGPGAEHVSVNANPLRRYALHAGAGPDTTIRNPARMPAARSAQVCGRCHGQRMTKDIERVHRQGDPFVPGDDLAHYSTPLARDTRQNGQPGLFAQRFWSDGTPRLTAYEYQGYLQSPCAKDPSFSCESCHAMHAGDPNGQLRPDRAGNALCTSCHSELAMPLTAAQHTRHSAAGSAARCVSCHMPNLVYGLVSVRLSHRIEIPQPARQAADGRPDACTLCHIDRTRGWAEVALRTLWPRTPAASRAIGSAYAELPEQAHRLLAGDPIERAVAADALGRTGTQAAAAYSANVIGLLSDALVSDPYPAVRAIAKRSLQQVLGRAHPDSAKALGAYTATDSSVERQAALSAVLRSLNPAEVAVPEASLRTRLRAMSEQAAIEIGE